jgi:hypothetical protein
VEVVVVLEVEVVVEVVAVVVAVVVVAVIVEVIVEVNILDIYLIVHKVQQIIRMCKVQLRRQQ